jgi:predicted DCC family thiol-disulfide oxidoreductase YuxK
MNPFAGKRGEVWLVYDGECPICKMYCTRVRIQKTVGQLHLVDARQSSAIMDEITDAGLDIDQGMVVKFNDVMYYGDKAMHVITLLSTRSSLFNTICYYLFSSQTGSKIFYPIGKAFRNLILKLLGIQYINNLQNTRTTSSSRKEGK